MADETLVLSVAELQNRGWLLVEDGNHGEYRPRTEEFGHGEWAFIRAADMDGGCVHFAQAQRINATARRRIRKGVGAPGDVLLSHKGTVGKVAFVNDDAPPFVCSPQTTFWRSTDPLHIDRRYLYAFLCSREFQQQLDARKGETDMAPYVSLTAQRQLLITLPDIERQCAIGSLLGAIDDKIALNRRMNHTLEATAAALFRSWFVDFDPVVAKAEGRRGIGVPPKVQELLPNSLAEVEGATIPLGWHAAAFGDIAKSHRDFVAPRDIDSSLPYIGMDNMPRCSIALDAWETDSTLDSSKARYRRGDVLFGKLRPYFHKVGIAPNDGVCSTEILVLRPIQPEYYGLLVMMASSVEFVEYASAAAEGTRMPRVSWDYLARYPLVLPPLPVACEFTAMVQPMFDRIVGNVHENRTLAALRDTLLPQLLSGAIRLRDAERAVGAAV
ncbi:MAG: restriction endonuclease subunit S [Gemmatimonadaceae bacterium]|nr:restriction endonuclease subunit S [Gemmatimonadaceae bacterium]